MEQKLLSIYIGKDVTRICEVVKKSATSIVVNNATEVSTPPGALDDGYLTDIPTVAEAIRGCLFGRGFSANKVVFTISSKKIANKEVVIPYVRGDKKISQILEANSSEYFPMTTAGDFLFAHSVMETYQDEDGKKLRLTAVAAPRDLVECYYELADELRLTVENIDYVGNSVLQLLSLQMREGDTELVLQIEKDMTFVNVMSGKDIILQRSVPYGKNAVINSMMEIKKLTEKDAKTLLSNRDMLDRQVTEAEYAEAVRYLISSIGRIVEYHRSRNPERIIDGIKVFGEGSAIAGIDEVLKQELGANVTHFSTLQGVKVSGKAYLTSESALRYLANFGAILRPIGLTLNRGKGKEKVSRGVDRALWVIFLVGMLVSISCVSVQALLYLDADDENKKLDKKASEMATVETDINNYNDAIDAYNLVIDSAKSTENDNEMLLTLIDNFEQIMPEDMRVTSFESLDGAIIFRIQSPSVEAIADFAVNVENLSYVDGYLLETVTSQEAAIPGTDLYKAFVEDKKKESKKENDTDESTEEQNDPNADPYDKFLSKYRFYEYDLTVFVKKPNVEDKYDVYAKETLKSSTESDDKGGAK